MFILQSLSQPAFCRYKKISPDVPRSLLYRMNTISPTSSMMLPAAASVCPGAPVKKRVRFADVPETVESMNLIQMIKDKFALVAEREPTKDDWVNLLKHVQLQIEALDSTPTTPPPEAPVEEEEAALPEKPESQMPEDDEAAAAAAAEAAEAEEAEEPFSHYFPETQPLPCDLDE